MRYFARTVLVLDLKQATASADSSGGLDERGNPAGHILRQKPVWVWAKGGRHGGQQNWPGRPRRIARKRFYLALTHPCCASTPDESVGDPATAATTELSATDHHFMPMSAPNALAIYSV